MGVRLVILILRAWAGTAAAGERADVVVYGATPAGVAAACAAADDGHTVVLAEPSARVGGLVTSGLSHTDFRTFEGITGAYLDFTRRVQDHYRREYGPDSPQARGNFRGTHAEPKVNLAVFDALLAGRPAVRVLRSHPLAGVRVSGGRIGAVTVGATEVAGRFFIDATYEGDLMAAAGVESRVGREGRAEYGEALAPEAADGQLQAYNYRLVMTRDPGNRVAVTPPAGYRREDYAGALPLIESGKLARAVGKEGEPVAFKAQEPPLPNGKYDVNDVSRGVVRLSLPGENLGWPAGDAVAHREIAERHLRWNVGLLYFLQTDAAVPEAFRRQAAEWGFCKDEFADTGHLPPLLYVREARRMVGRHVFTQRDVTPAEGDARAVPRADSVGVGDYGPNCHGTGHDGPRFGGKHTGEFYFPVPPYQIACGTLVPKTVSNLLVPVACSASHVGFCALRLEPIWMNLGQAAGHAAHLAVADGEVRVGKLQARLHAAGAATVYVSDVPPGHADFAAVQWWGTAGGLHGLSAPPAGGPRGKRLRGQYYEAFPGHAAGLNEVLTPDVAARWRELANRLGLGELPAADGKLTRGEWLRAAFAAKKE